jgi:septal ring factor EnvC (AmiA/AmiB activator)
MNLIGKIFVVLIFIMSLVFMAFSVAVYGTHQNWKKTAEKLKTDVQTERDKFTKLEEEKKKLEEDIAKEAIAKREALAKLETEKAELQKQRDEMSKQRDELMVKDKAAVAALDAAQQNLAKLTTEVEGLRGEIREAQAERDKHFAQVVKLTDQIHQAQGDLKRLDERNVQLASQVAASRKVLDAHGLSKDTPVDGIPPQIRGKVLAINQDNMIEVSLGSDDGLRAGHTLEIFRASNYLGRLQVLRTDTDRAVGKILPGFKKAAIQKGDDVATRFKVG